MDWIYEGRLSVYFALATVAAILIGLWWRDRQSAWLAAILPVVLLAVLYFLLDWSVETRGEQISRKLHEMAAAVRARDASRILGHLSPQFTYRGTTHEAFRKHVEATLRDGWIDELTIWDIRPEGEGVRLLAKPKGRVAVGLSFLVRTRWVQDADMQYRMATFEVFHTFADTDKPVDVPNLPH